MPYKRLTSCVCCGSHQLRSCLDLGTQPLANNLVSDPQTPIQEYELKTQVCESCYHMQLTISVQPDIMFDDYVYVSGTSQTLRDYFDWFANWCNFLWPCHTCVLDIACNDGSQLNSFKRLGYQTLGVDPAKNLHAQSSQQHDVICAYFDHNVVSQLSDKHIDLIVAQNVLAHTPDPLSFLQNCKHIMHDGSRLLVQTSQAHMILRNEFDTLYHEHVSYFSVHSMQALVARAGLQLINVYETPVHGTSYVFEIALQPQPESNVQDHLIREHVLGLTDPRTYNVWQQQAHKLLTELAQRCDIYTKAGYQVWGLGAAAKGITVLQAAQLNLQGVFDENPLKCHKWIPGVNCLVVPFTQIASLNPQTPCVFVCMAWNYLTELTHKVRELRQNGQDIMLTYFPEIQERAICVKP